MVDWLRHFIDIIVQFTADHPSLTGLLLMAFAAAEAIIVVGALVPGEAMVLALAAAAGAAGASPWRMLLWVTLGAILGDGVSFYIGRRHDDAVAGWPLVRSHPEMLARAEAFIQRRGVMAVVIGRFLPGLRAIMPVAAGVLGMPPGRFYAANAASAVAWAAAHVFPAVALGQAYTQLGAISGRLTAILALLLLVLFLLIWLVRAFFVWVTPRLMVLLRWLARRLARRKDPVSRLMARLLDPQRGKSAGMLVWGGLLVAAAGGFMAVLEDLLSGDPLVRADVAIHHFLQSLRTEPMDAVMVAVTSLGDGPVVLAVAAAFIVTLVAQRAWRVGLAAGVTIGAAALLVPLLKALLHKPRPIPLQGVLASFAFPSGHTTMTTVVFGVMAVLAARRLSFGPRLATYGLYALWAGLVGFSRVYLAAHWPSDVLGGFFIGLALVAAFALWLDLAEPEACPGARRGLLASVAALAALVVAGGVHLHARFQRNLALYAPRQKIEIVSLATWLRDGWRALPRRRIDLKGEREEPVLAQWADDPARIRAVLARHGWRVKPMPSLRDALVFLLPDMRLADLPALPLLHRGRLPALMFSRSLPGGEERLVLRFWRSDVRVRIGARAWPLHLATVTRERLRRLGPLGTALRERPVKEMPKALSRALREEPALLIVAPAAGPLLVHRREDATGKE